MLFPIRFVLVPTFHVHSTPVSFHLCTVKYFFFFLSQAFWSAHYKHNNLHNSRTPESYGFPFFSEKKLAPAYPRKPSSWWHERANLLLDIYFSDTRFWYIFFCFSVAESSAQKHRQLQTSNYWLSWKFFFASSSYSLVFLSLVLPLSKRFFIFKWKNHGIYEIHSTALIIAHGTIFSSLPREFFSIYVRGIKDDTWDDMRDDRRRVGGERRDSNQSSCAINYFGGFCGWG